MNDECKKIVREFLVFLESFYREFGVFSGQKDSLELARELLNRFHGNLVSLENYFITKDSLGATLMQRYNHELVIDFYYLMNPGGEYDKMERFFNYNILSATHHWSSKLIGEKRSFVPPWVANEESLKKVYRKLSDLAHPNIMSVQLNRKGSQYEYLMIKDAICFSMFEICLCLQHKPLQGFFPDINWAILYDPIQGFKSRATELLLRQDA